MTMMLMMMMMLMMVMMMRMMIMRAFILHVCETLAKSAPLTWAGGSAQTCRGSLCNSFSKVHVSCRGQATGQAPIRTTTVAKGLGPSGFVE